MPGFGVRIQSYCPKQVLLMGGRGGILRPPQPLKALAPLTALFLYLPIMVIIMTKSFVFSHPYA